MPSETSEINCNKHHYVANEENFSFSPNGSASKDLDLSEAFYTKATLEKVLKEKLGDEATIEVIAKDDNTKKVSYTLPDENGGRARTELGTLRTIPAPESSLQKTYRPEHIPNGL